MSKVTYPQTNACKSTLTETEPDTDTPLDYEIIVKKKNGQYDTVTMIVRDCSSAAAAMYEAASCINDAFDMQIKFE